MYRKYTYNIYIIVLILLLALLPYKIAAQQPYDFEEGGLYFKKAPSRPDAAVYVTAKPSGTGTYSGDIVIPSSIQSNSYDVVGLDNNCFKGCTLNSVTFHVSGPVIGPEFFLSSSCFANCKIESLDLSVKRFTYTDNCFNKCQIKNLTIGINSIDSNHAIWKELSKTANIGTLHYKHSAGFFSFVTFKDFDFSTATNVEAYYATSDACNALGSKQTLSLTQATGKVPANTALFLYVTDSNNACTIPTATDDDATPLANYPENMKGSITDSYTVQENDNIYALNKEDHKLHPVSAGVVVIPPGITYLSLQYTRSVIDISAGTTGIEKTETEETGNVVHYDLNGNQIDKHEKGLHIINGRKIIVR